MAISKFYQGCPAQQRQRRAASFFRTNLGSEGMAPPSQPVAASPPIPSSLFIANNPLLVVSTHINPLLVLVVSTHFELLLVLLVLCAIALLLFHFTPLSHRLSSYVRGWIHDQSRVFSSETSFAETSAFLIQPVQSNLSSQANEPNICKTRLVLSHPRRLPLMRAVITIYEERLGPFSSCNVLYDGYIWNTQFVLHYLMINY